MIFKDISNFNNVNDYLPIFNGCLNADLIFMFLLYHGAVKSKMLKQWYKKFSLSAVIADVFILMIGIIITRFIYKYFFNEFSILKFTALAVGVQIIHDVLFYTLFKNTPLGYNYMLDFFKKYADEMGGMAIIGDSFMMIMSCLLTSYFATLNLNNNIITMIISVYFIPYMIYYEA
jgi:hypothetical protein